jgi:hypothetical protein
VNQDETKTREILDNAAPVMDGFETKKSGSGCGYVFLWFLVLLFSFISGFSLPLVIIPLTLAGFGIKSEYKDFKKSRILFFFKALVWIAPLFFTLLIARADYQRNKRISTDMRIETMRREIDQELTKEWGKLDPKQIRPGQVVIQEFLKKTPTPLDAWGRPFRAIYPGVHGYVFDLYSAGPDGVYGNADDIGNW